MNTRKNRFQDSLMKQLKDPEFICEYLNNAIEENDPDFLKVAMGDVAKALGVTEISKNTSISRQSIYQMLSAEGNPSLSSIFQIMAAMNLKVRIEPLSK